jgi:hypothetical protein
VRVRLAGATVALLAVVLAVGCGGGSDDTAKIKQTIRRELTALADGDGATGCSLATPARQAKLVRALPGAMTCDQVIKAVGQRLPASVKDGLRSAQVKKVTVHGNTATVQDADITSARGNIAAFLQPGSPPTVLTEQPDGTWKISR